MAAPEAKQQDDSPTIIPTYGALTAERILAHFGINLEHSQLLSVIKNTESGYFQLLRVPFINLVNGIVLQQSYDYQVYVQKLFVDYLMSGEGNADNAGPGEHIREELEAKRTELVKLGKDFEENERKHKLFIAESQTFLIKLVKEINSTGEIEEQAQIIIEKAGPYILRAEEIGESLRDFRTQFKESIVQTKEMLHNLSEYTVNDAQDEDNLSSLKFDDKIV